MSCNARSAELGVYHTPTCIDGGVRAAQLQEDRMWASWMDIAFAKLDVNGDGFISLEELLSCLPEATATANAADEGERLNAVRSLKYPWDVQICSKGRQWE